MQDKSKEKHSKTHTIKLTKSKHKERILKAAREKQKVTYKGNPICLTAIFQEKLCRPEGNGRIYLKYLLKGKNLQPRFLYPARISFKINGEITSFSERQS